MPTSTSPLCAGLPGSCSAFRTQWGKISFILPKHICKGPFLPFEMISQLLGLGHGNLWLWESISSRPHLAVGGMLWLALLCLCLYLPFALELPGSLTANTSPLPWAQLSLPTPHSSHGHNIFFRAFHTATCDRPGVTHTLHKSPSLRATVSEQKGNFFFSLSSQGGVSVWPTRYLGMTLLFATFLPQASVPHEGRVHHH